jgi:lysyl-tRNA synthetase class 2
MPTTGEDALRNERVKKLDYLRDAGMEAYPVSVEKDYTIAEFVSRFETLMTDGATATLVGRIMSLRGQGGIMFAELFDGTGRTQAVFQKDVMDESAYALFERAVDVGDFIQVSGTPFVTKRGTQSLQVASWKMVSKSLLPIPDAHFGLKDEEKILRERYLDILLHSEVRDMIVRRATFWATVRNYYLEHGFLEVETPIFENTPGGADARPFTSYHNALDIDVYLRIAIELPQKKLLVAGFPRVFEIGRIFRNEGQSREHLQDYTQVESYEAYSDMRTGMRFIQDLYRKIALDVYGKYTFEINGHTVDLADEWVEVDYCGRIKSEFGIDPLTCTDDEAITTAEQAGLLKHGEEANKARAVDLLWKKIRKSISGPAFLVGLPVYMEPLAKSDSRNSAVVERFQILIAGSEMGKGFSELNDPIDQRARFVEQEKLRAAGDDEAQRLDLDYIRAMEYGMPPAFGFGMSERLFSFLENRPAHEAQIFPLLRPKE